MYAWLWRHLPGPWPARTLACVLLVLAVVVVLFTLVFPWVEPRLPFNKVTVGHSTPGSS
jgi:hypothetical protein